MPDWRSKSDTGEFPVECPLDVPTLHESLWRGGVNMGIRARFEAEVDMNEPVSVGAHIDLEQRVLFGVESFQPVEFGCLDQATLEVVRPAVVSTRQDRRAAHLLGRNDRVRTVPAHVVKAPQNAVLAQDEEQREACRMQDDSITPGGSEHARVRHGDGHLFERNELLEQVGRTAPREQLTLTNTDRFSSSKFVSEVHQPSGRSDTFVTSPF